MGKLACELSLSGDFAICLREGCLFEFGFEWGVVICSF